MNDLKRILKPSQINEKLVVFHQSMINKKQNMSNKQQLKLQVDLIKQIDLLITKLPLPNVITYKKITESNIEYNNIIDHSNTYKIKII